MSATIRFSSAFSEIFKKSASALEFDFLPNHQSVKHVIEYLGIPHTEVGSLLVRDREIDFHYRPQHADVIEVGALDGPVDVTKPSSLRPAFPDVQFIVDECVASLAPKLRMLGLDVLYSRELDDQKIADISFEQKRIVLTRDRGLLMRKEVIWGRFIRSTNPRTQLQEVMDHFGLEPLENALQRCLVCNGLLASVDKEKILDLLGPKTREFFDDFSQCQSCQKIYWEGSHYSKMKESLENWVESPDQPFSS